MPLSREALNASNSPDLAISKFARRPDGQPGVSQSMEQIEEQSAIDRAWEALKKFVFNRDKGCCRVCGKRVFFGAAKLADRADVHHIIFASAGGPDESWNLLLTCRRCHDLVHKLKALFLSGDADARDEMGKGMVKAEKPIEGGFEVVGFV